MKLQKSDVTETQPDSTMTTTTILMPFCTDTVQYGVLMSPKKTRHYKNRFGSDTGKRNAAYINHYVWNRLAITNIQLLTFTSTFKETSSKGRWQHLPHLQILGEPSMIHSRPQLFLSISGDQPAPTNSTYEARIIPQWLSKSRWL